MALTRNTPSMTMHHIDPRMITQARGIVFEDLSSQDKPRNIGWLELFKVYRCGAKIAIILIKKLRLWRHRELF